MTKKKTQTGQKSPRKTEREPCPGPKNIRQEQHDDQIILSRSFQKTW